MSVYLIGAIDIHDAKEYSLYREGVREALAPFNVEVLSVDHHPVMMEGSAPAGHMFIIKFHSADDLQRFFASEKYQRIIGHRHRASDTKFVIGMRSPDEMEVA